jgi:hypothetical protein
VAHGACASEDHRSAVRDHRAESGDPHRHQPGHLGLRGPAKSAKPYLKPMVLFYKDYVIGEDPTDVNLVMLKLHRTGTFKPWDSAVRAKSRCETSPGRPWEARRYGLPPHHGRRSFR